jgi:adenosylcobyric acid synthase
MSGNADGHLPGRAPCLMVQGTGSGVGKSVLTAALCRLFARAGYRVAPFKSQNMALNASVTADGGEIGRAQAAQAEAAGVEPTVDMNPILLKPEGDDRSQVVVRGRPVATVDWREYARMQAGLLPIVAESLERLRRTHDLVVIEGAGSPAEINLAASEIVNMRIARLADARVLLVGDIDRGGVFAALVGTLALLAPADRARVGGFVVNKFRGDAALLAPGLEELTARTGVPVLGVLPWIAGRLTAAEDSLDLDAPGPRAQDGTGEAIEVAVVRFPRIANFDDFEPLAEEPGVRVRFVTTPAALGAADLIVLPGSKNTAGDLRWLSEHGLGEAIRAAAAAGRPVLGICGGFQMLGEALLDPEGVESPAPATPGLGLLPVVTTFSPSKTTVRVRARVLASSGLFAAAAGSEVRAYEIHAGRTRIPEGARRLFSVVESAGEPAADTDGVLNVAGNVGGTYLHGLFAGDALRGALLRHLATRAGIAADPRWGAPREDPYERLADAVGGALDLAAVAKLAGVAFPRA